MTTIEILSELRSNYNCFDEQEEPVYRALSEAIRAVSTQPEPQWIPCSERLPEYDGGTYLVTDYCEQIGRKRIHVSYCYMNKDGFWSDVPLGYKVIAWMPLPEPYKEEKNDYLWISGNWQINDG